MTRAVAPTIAALAALVVASAPPGQAAASPQTLAARYLAIAEAGNRHLDRDFDSLEGPDKDNLVRSRADLRDAAATERLFDRRLLTLAFPRAIEALAHDLYRVNQLRARLTFAASVAATLADIHSYEPALDTANGPVERDVRAIRRSLGLPPPDTS
ncbi:MAG TPA: hypothetical protein VHX66_17480 [Solirubrobacteraceae bacterium]|jgi:hypothetical protein|nr:hypothetical protein [Solirubrobacteraceae bacterium]